MRAEVTRVRDEWEALAQIDPMWAILTTPSKAGLGWQREEFFESGRVEVGNLVNTLDAFAADRALDRALDFGCGLGRVTQALAAHYARADGVDVSASMIKLAETFNREPDRCTYHVNERDDLSLFADAAFDLVYTNMVLQHMKPRLARSYLREFARCTKPRGLIVFQVPSRRRLNYGSLHRYAQHAIYSVLPTRVVRGYRRWKNRNGELPAAFVDRLPKVPMRMTAISKATVGALMRRDSDLLTCWTNGSKADAFESVVYVFRKHAAG